MNEFAILDITQASFDNGACFRVQTDVPCHLTMHITTTEPRRHKVARVQRGLTIPWSAYFCFVAWQTLEQEEPGDTLFHTFPLTGFLSDQHIWITWAGTIAATPSPSRGPIIKRTHPGQDVILNYDWWDWPFGTPDPDYWIRFTDGSGWSEWIRETSFLKYCAIGPRLLAGGYARGTGYQQIQPAARIRNQSLRVNIWAKGFANPMTRLTVRTDGSAPWMRHDPITISNVWQLLSVEGLIPDDATYIWVDILNWSPGYGPTTTLFDLLTVDLL